MNKTIFSIFSAIILCLAVSCSNSAGGSTPTPTPSPSGYSIEISYIEDSSGQTHGTVAPSKTKGIAQGEKISLAITPENNYQLDKLYCQYYDGGDIPKNIDVTDNSFVMPNKNVYIGASFKENPTLHNVSASETQNGKIQFSANGSDPQDSCQAAKGTTVTIFVLPNEGYEIDALAASAGGNELTINGSSFAMPEDDVTVSATFKPVIKTYTVAIGTMTGGSVTASPGTSVAAGTTVTLNPTADSGYVLDSLTVKDASGSDVLTQQNAFAMPQSDVTVTAVFKKGYKITINKPTNGNIGVETPRGRWTTNDGAQTVTAFAGETIVYDAILESGSIYKLKSFAINGVDGIDASKQKNSFVMPQSDVTISATFKEKSKYYIGTKCNTGEKDEYGYDKYETTSPYGMLTCDKEYAREGEKVTVTVKPTTGGAGEKDYAVEKLCLVYNLYPTTILIPIDKAGGQVTFTVPDADTAIEVRAKFAEKTYSIKLADNITGGSITGFNSSGNHLGQKIRLFVTPDDGYKLTGISIEGASVTLDDCYCFEMPKADITIKPTFESGTGRSITINPSEHGSVSCAKTTDVMPGSTVVLMANPASGYKLNSFTVKTNGSEEVTVSDNTFIMPDSDVSVSAEFCNGKEHNVYVWITLSDTTKAERWRKNIAPGTVVTSDGLPAGYVISSVYVTKYVTEHPELWNQGEDIQLTSRTDTDYSFVMPDCDAHVHIYLKAPVKPKPDTIGDIVLEDGTAVAYENRSKLSETQKWHSIAVIFYDGKASTDLGNCVLGVGLAEGIGNWCYQTETASYIKIPEITANPIRWGEPVTHAEFGKEVPVFGYPKHEREVTFTGETDGQIRGTNNLSKVKSYLGNDFHLDKMKAFEYCEEYKDQDGSRLKWIEDKQYQTGWYLPTIAELTYLLEKVGLVNRCISDVYGKTIRSEYNIDDYYWSSSQVSGNKLEAWLAISESDDPYVCLLSYSKANFNYIRAIREF